MLRIEGLAKQYRGRQVVQSASMEVHRGQIVGLLGPNGAGKTTCFYMIVGLIPADAGRIELDGQDITHLPVHRRARAGLGYLPQEASVFRKMTVEDNILAILELREDLSPGQRQERLEALLADLQITPIRKEKGYSLSGGERRRVEIARALAAEPAFMLLDEPFAGVDPISVGEIQRIIQHLKSRNIGVLITDHNVRETLGICEHAYILGEGRMLAEGPPEAILADEKVRAIYLGEHFTL